MLKSEKETLIKELNDKFTRAKSLVLVETSKVNVETITKLRKKLRDGGVEFKVLKNTLAKRAAKGTAFEVIAEDFVGPVSASFSYGDEVAPAKIMSEFIKDLETIKIKSGVVAGKKMTAKEVAVLAKLPGLNELRGKILGMINQPAGKLARTIAEPANKLARVLKAKSEQK
ncbi:MAG: 50S ribosomal protein L10 [Myxococcaceae bacterium]|nr:50S ribosomal protein L10 [Myxococcaceae bacterium]